jgi:hypothetical protein
LVGGICLDDTNLAHLETGNAVGPFPDGASVAVDISMPDVRITGIWAEPDAMLIELSLARFATKQVGATGVVGRQNLRRRSGYALVDVVQPV